MHHVNHSQLDAPVPFIIINMNNPYIIGVDVVVFVGTVLFPKGQSNIVHIFRKFDFFLLPVITFFLFVLCK